MMTSFATYALLLWLSWFSSALSAADVDGRKTRGAVIVTLAGNHKLADYFEWNCKTFGSSSDLFDMLVFHESNTKLMELKCAKNVKFVNLGSNGLSKHLIDKILEGSASNASVKGRMAMMLNDILLHGPRYLVEIKPMMGDLFAEHLTPYTHWSYTDPDIIWGNLADWVDVADLDRFDVVTYAKTMDAGRLFIRGQLAFHKNTERINKMWKQLTYFAMSTYPERLGNAFRMLQEKKTSDEIFSRNFVSAEGWYSQLMFKANISTKIIGRGFDDFYRHPVVVYKGRLTRCGLNGNLTECVSGVKNALTYPSVHSLPAMKLVPAKAYYEASQCKMFWLPTDTRYCIAAPVYAKKALLQKEARASDRVKLVHVGESVYENGEWSINDEQEARRQVPESAAFFHFRHWDDFISKSISTTWNPASLTEGENYLGCMILYLRHDAALAFESCSSVVMREGRGEDVLLVQSPQQVGESASMTVAKKLIHQRKESEVGPNMHFDSSNKKAAKVGRGGKAGRSKRQRGAAAGAAAGGADPSTGNAAGAPGGEGRQDSEQKKGNLRSPHRPHRAPAGDKSGKEGNRRRQRRSKKAKKQ